MGGSGLARGNIRRRSRVRQDSWTVQIYLGRDPETGRKRYHSESVRGSRAAAERRLTELQRSLDTGTLTSTPACTVAEYLHGWLRDYVAPLRRSSTWYSYRGVVERYLLPGLGGIPLNRLTSSRVLELESALLRSGGSRGGGLSARTVGYVHRVLHKALQDAVRSGLLLENVVRQVEPPRPVRYEARSLTWAEVGRLLVETEDSRYRDLFLLAVQTGLRRSELVGLQCRDVDLAGGFLSVRRGIVWASGQGLRSLPPKSGRARVVALPPESRAMLAARLRGGVSGDAPVFAGAGGGWLSPNRLTAVFRQVAWRAGLEGFRFHDLRHTHASLLLAEGVHLKVVSERLGHSAVGITGGSLFPRAANGPGRGGGAVRPSLAAAGGGVAPGGLDRRVSVSGL